MQITPTHVDRAVTYTPMNPEDDPALRGQCDCGRFIEMVAGNVKLLVATGVPSLESIQTEGVSGDRLRKFTGSQFDTTAVRSDDENIGALSLESSDPPRLCTCHAAFFARTLTDADSTSNTDNPLRQFPTERAALYKVLPRVDQRIINPRVDQTVLAALVDGIGSRKVDLLAVFHGPHVTAP